MPWVRPYAEANPSASSANATPTIRSFAVSVANRWNPTTHGETARYSPVRTVSPSTAWAVGVSAAASYVARSSARWGATSWLR